MNALADLIKYSLTGDVLYHGVRFQRANEAATELEKIIDECKFMSMQIDRMNQVMECGHLGRYQIRDIETDTQYCCVCALERMSLFIAYNSFGENANSLDELSQETKKNVTEIMENE